MFPLREWGFDSPPGHHVRIVNAAPNSPQGTPGPTFRELLGGSLRVCGFTLGLALLAFLLWLGLRWLFPDVGWLQPPS